MAVHQAKEYGSISLGSGCVDEHISHESSFWCNYVFFPFSKIYFKLTLIEILKSVEQGPCMIRLYFVSDT
jgi:hypothetical protein